MAVVRRRGRLRRALRPGPRGVAERADHTVPRPDSPSWPFCPLRAVALERTALLSSAPSCRSLLLSLPFLSEPGEELRRRQLPDVCC